METYTSGPWHYRPSEHDDWGFVRAANGALVAVARGGSLTVTEAELDAHREAGSDPYEANAAFIVKACNSHADLLAALYVAADALDNYSDVTDGDDGQPVANRAMSALAEVTRAIAKAEGAK